MYYRVVDRGSTRSSQTWERCAVTGEGSENQGKADESIREPWDGNDGIVLLVLFVIALYRVLRVTAIVTESNTEAALLPGRAPVCERDTGLVCDSGHRTSCPLNPHGSESSFRGRLCSSSGAVP